MSKSALRKAIAALVAPCLGLPVAAMVPAHAQTADAPMEAPVAGLRIFSGASLSTTWYGSGSISVDAPLCLSSSSGSYRLSVTPSLGLQKLAQGGEVRIGLAERGGKALLKPVEGLATLYFTGTVDPAEGDCREGPNAKLVVELPEGALMAAPAGNYFDQLQLEIEAL